MAVVAVGLVGWVVTLRADLNVAQAQVAEVREHIPPLQAEAKQCAIEIHNLHELIKDIDKIEEVRFLIANKKEQDFQLLIDRIYME